MDGITAPPVEYCNTTSGELSKGAYQMNEAEKNLKTARLYIRIAIAIMVIDFVTHLLCTR